jgi:PAS domain S-box-containing protein
MANEDVQKTLADLSRELQESKARLEEAQRVAHVGHWEWDLETDVVVWSDETYRIFGLGPQERPMDLATVRSMVHPDDREPLYQAVDKDLIAGERPSGEFRIVRPSGEVRTVSSLTSERWSSLASDTKRDASGRPYRLFGTIQDITDQKRSEEAFREISRKLQESNAMLEEAQRISHVGHYSWNLIENQVVWSDEVYRIYGLDSRQDTIDLAKVSEMIHPEDRELVFRAAEEALRSGTRADIEHRLVRPDGEVRTIHSVGTVKRDASGRPYEMFGTAQDITDRKRFEEVLKRNQFYLSEGQRIAHIGSWAFNDSGHYWSDELFKIYGLDPHSGAPTVEQYLALIHPENRASMAETIRRMQEEKCGFDQLERIIRPDGQLRYVRAVAVPDFEQGVFKGFIGTTMDVTEQELLTQELRRDQAYLAEAQSLTHIGSWATNFHTKQIFHISDETFRLHGFDPKKGPIPLERFFDSIHQEDRSAVTETLESAIRSRTDYDIREYRVVLPDSRVRFLRSIGHHDPSGGMGYYIGITMDVSERKQAEQEREKLRQLESDLAHINRVNMMGELAAALAHEIRQPIAASITSANACLRWLARNPPDLERARAAAARIEQDGNRAADVISRLRSFYTKGVAPEREKVDIRDVVREMTALLKREAVQHSIKIHSELADDLPEVLADRVQLQQVFMNLMLNAIEAMKGKGGKLTISSEMTTEDQVVVSIRDTGVGLSAENTERIFDAFHTTKPQGTGMGLAITRSIVEAHGGRVWAISNLEGGATFHFTFPTRREADP